MTAVSDLVGTLTKDLGALKKSVADAEQSYAAKHLLRGTRDDVVELTLIRAMGLFEEFIGELFYLALQGDLGPEVRPLMRASSRDEASRLVAGADSFGEARYVSWMPLPSRTLSRAHALLRNGEPFRRLESRAALQRSVNDLTVVRNRIAHASETAKQKFVNVATGKGYPHTRAADFLTSTRGTKIEILWGLDELEAIARGLADASEVSSLSILGDDDLFKANAISPPGTYECNLCQKVLVTTDFSKLGACGDCPRPQKCAVCARQAQPVDAWKRVIATAASTA